MSHWKETKVSAGLLPGPLAEVDPRARLASALLLTVAIPVMPPFPAALFLAALLLLLGLAGPDGVSLLLSTGKSMVPLAFFGILLHGLGGNGLIFAPLGDWGPKFGSQGLQAGMLITMRLYLAYLLCSLLSRSTKPEELVAAFGWLFAPLGKIGLPVGEFTRQLGKAYLMVPLLLSSIDERKRAGGEKSPAGARQFFAGLLDGADGYEGDGPKDGAVFQGGRFGVREWGAVGFSGVVVVFAFLAGGAG